MHPLNCYSKCHLGHLLFDLSDQLAVLPWIATVPMLLDRGSTALLAVHWQPALCRCVDFVRSDPATYASAYQMLAYLLQAQNAVVAVDGSQLALVEQDQPCVVADS